jgi:hypothetical protein
MGKAGGRRPVIDPAVADMLSEMERKKRISHMPRSEQGKARKNAQRYKVGLDLPPALHEALRQAAEKEHISVSALAAFFLYRGMTDYEAGRVDLSPFKQASRCARFDYILNLTKLEKSK